MKSNWQTMTLGEVTKWSSGGTPKKSEESYWGGDIPWISASSMDGHLYSDSKLKITEDGLANGSRLAPKDSLLILVRGSILHQKMQVGLATRSLAFNQDVKCLVANEEFIDSWYLLLWFKAKEQELLSLVESTGIGAGKFDTKLLSGYPIKIPPKGERNNIKAFGKALFDKTTNLEITNQTLEQVAKALFTSWFVNFDPVFDNALATGMSVSDFPEALQKKAERRQEVQRSISASEIDVKPLPKDIRQLFPREFEQTNEPNIGIAGWIPKGWVIDSFSKVAILKNKSVHPNKEPSKVWAQFSLPAFDARQLPTQDLGCEIKSGKYRISKNTVLVSKLNPHTPRIWMPKVKDVDISVCSTEFMPFEPVIDEQRVFVYSLMSSENVMLKIASRVTGTTGSHQRVSPKEVAVMPIILPSSECISSFCKVVKSGFDKIGLNLEQNFELTKLRDTLLPKLISGELQLQE